MGIRKKLNVMIMLVAIIMLFSTVTVLAQVTDDQISQFQTQMQAANPSGKWDGSSIDNINLSTLKPSTLASSSKTEKGQYVNKASVKVSLTDSTGKVTEETLTLYFTDSQITKFASGQSQTGDVKQSINDAINGVQLTPNVEQASEMASGFTPILSIFMGFIIYAILIIMPLLCGLDILYILSPSFQEKAEGARNGEGGMSRAMTKTNSNGKTSLRFISREAQHAVENSHLSEGKNPLITYFQLSIIKYLAVAALLTMFFTGNIQILTQLAVNIISGIMSVIDSLGKG